MTINFHIPVGALWFVGGIIVGIIVIGFICRIVFQAAIGRHFGW